LSAKTIHYSTPINDTGTSGQQRSGNADTNIYPDLRWFAITEAYNLKQPIEANISGTDTGTSGQQQPGNADTNILPTPPLVGNN
jgi:hypothetical protein